MPNPHTQKLFNEIKKPSHVSKGDAEAAILAFLPVLGLLAKQAAEGSSLAQMAEMAEEDGELRGRLEPFVQTDGAQRRICSEIERHLRDLMTALRQRERYHREVSDLLAAKGYDP